MGLTSRRKGASGEREAAKVLTEYTGCQWERGIRQSRRGGKEGADVVCSEFDHLHVEVKRGKQPPIRPAMRQAIGDCGDKTPLVVSRQDHGEWLVTMRLIDWADMAEAARLGRS